MNNYDFVSAYPYNLEKGAGSTARKLMLNQYYGKRTERMNRIDIPQAILCAVALAVAGAIVVWGPPEHRTTIGALVVTSVSTILAALRGRLFKRNPQTFEKKE